MKAYKQLAGQTAVYGLSSILGRLLNYLLVPLYTRLFAEADYGVVTQLYSYIALFNILFTYGLETSFFRYFQTEKGNPKIYSTSLLSISISSVVFALLLIIFSQSINKDFLSSIENGNSYIKYVAGILAFDAISAIPFAKLRQENKAKRFAILRLINIGINIGLNLFFLVLCPALLKTDSSSWVNVFYNPEIGIGYVFISNLIASAATVLLLSPEIFSSKFEFDTALWKNMIIYSFPLMIAGFAGMINETIDRILIPYLINDKTDAMVQLGIYGACYKLSIIMTLFIQTFRYAAEPFFFSQSTGEQPQKVYAEVMNYFVIVCSFIFLSVMLYIDVVKLFIGPAYRSGLVVVPILLMANLCLGVFYNLSIWYKLTAKTTWGAWISILGAIITLALNFWLIPVMGYLGAAWATLICYASMMVISYSFGQKYYHVPYKVFSFFRYTILALVLWLVSRFFENNYTLSSTSKFLIHTALLLVFVFITWIYERGKINYLRSRK